jgi:hypothetical protein
MVGYAKVYDIDIFGMDDLVRGGCSAGVESIAGSAAAFRTAPGHRGQDASGSLYGVGVDRAHHTDADHTTAWSTRATHNGVSP